MLSVYVESTAAGLVPSVYESVSSPQHMSANALHCDLFVQLSVAVYLFCVVAI